VETWGTFSYALSTREEAPTLLNPRTLRRPAHDVTIELLGPNVLLNCPRIYTRSLRKSETVPITSNHGRINQALSAGWNLEHRGVERQFVVSTESGVGIVLFRWGVCHRKTIRLGYYSSVPYPTTISLVPGEIHQTSTGHQTASYRIELSQA